MTVMAKNISNDSTWKLNMHLICKKRGIFRMRVSPMNHAFLLKKRHAKNVVGDDCARLIDDEDRQITSHIRTYFYPIRDIIYYSDMSVDVYASCVYNIK